MKTVGRFFKSTLLLFIAISFLKATPCFGNDFIYVANVIDNSVSVVDQNSNVVFATIPVGPGLFDMVITPDGRSLFVLNGDNSILLIDSSSPDFSVTATINESTFGVLPPGKWGNLGISPDGKTLYFTIRGVFMGGTILACHATAPFAPCLAILSVTENVPITHIAITPDGKKGYSGVQFSANAEFGVESFDTPGIYNTTIKTDANATLNCAFATASPARQLVFLSAMTPGEEDVGQLIAIDPATDRVIAKITVGADPQGIAASPTQAGKQYIYVPNGRDGAISVIDDSNFTVVRSVAVGKEPDAIATTTDHQRAYVANFRDNTLSVLNISDPGAPQVMKTISVGQGPNAIVTGRASFVPKINN